MLLLLLSSMELMAIFCIEHVLLINYVCKGKICDMTGTDYIKAMYHKNNCRVEIHGLFPTISYWKMHWLLLHKLQISWIITHWMSSFKIGWNNSMIISISDSPPHHRQNLEGRQHHHSSPWRHPFSKLLR